MPGLTNLRQGSGVTPDSGNTVLRSGVGRSYRQLPVRERVRREAASCRNRLLIKRYSRSGIGYRRCDFFFEPEYPCGGYFECTSLRLQSLSFRFFNHIKCNLRSRKRPKPGEVLAGAGTHGSTPCKYAVRRVISASEGHERASPLVHGDYVRRIGFRFIRRDCVCRIRLRRRGATIKECRRNTGDNDDQNASHASSPVLKQ